MNDNFSEQPLADKQPAGGRETRRRKHSPKPNIATWLVLAWLAFMAAWGLKHAYVQWFGAGAEPQGNPAPAEMVVNATAPGGVSLSGPADPCPIK